MENTNELNLKKNVKLIGVILDRIQFSESTDSINLLKKIRV